MKFRHHIDHLEVDNSEACEWYCKYGDVPHFHEASA